MSQPRHNLTEKDPETGKDRKVYDFVQYTNGPVFDLFMNVQWKRACIFVKWENTGRGWPMAKRDYFTADRYTYTDRQIKLGIYWPFYTMSGKQTTLSSKAGSGLGGGMGGGGLGGMLGGGGLGGMMGGRNNGGF